MSLLPLVRVTFVGAAGDKQRLIEELQKRGCLELIPLGDGPLGQAIGATSTAREALGYLASCKPQRRPSTDETQFDAADVEQKALALKANLHSLELERDDLILKLEAMQPWGDFHFPAPGELADLKLWFYAVPVQDMNKVERSTVAWQVVRRDRRLCHLVVVSASEPQGMPSPPLSLGDRSRKELERRLEAVENAIEDAQAERVALTRWRKLLSRDLNRLDDAAARVAAEQATCDRGPLFGLEGWAPADRAAELATFAASAGLVFSSRVPAQDDDPPTLLHNRKRLAAGEDLVNFYMTPGYWTWDPSGVVLVSFAVFFAMILADAGYAALLGLALGVSWRRLGRSATGQRFRPLLALLVGLSLVYGVLVGSYFGVAPAPESFLGGLHQLDMNDSRAMMGLSVLVGGLHLVLANVMDARRRPHLKDGLASIGWACAIAGGLLLAMGTAMAGAGALRFLGGAAIVGGLLLVVGFTAPREKPLPRLVQGLLGLTRISGAFGDVLSYLRLFALGLASASLATAFNDMAAGLSASAGRIGAVLAIVVLLFGHSLNLLLGVSSGLIHGLRLNVIEFFNWGLKEEGRRFLPFEQKERSVWTN